MSDLRTVGLVACWTAVCMLAFILLLFALIVPVPLASIIGGAALVTVGGVVTGGLLASSFEHTEEDS